MNMSDDENFIWFQSYLNQSVTFSSWKKVEFRVSQIIKQNAEKKLMDPVNRQIIFQMLGRDFVDKYFPSYTNSPTVLENIRLEERRKKENTLQNYISTVINDALDGGSKSDSKIHSDISAFSEELQNVAESNIENQFSEIKSKKKIKIDLYEKCLKELTLHYEKLASNLIQNLQKDIPNLPDNFRKLFWPVCLLPKEKPKNNRNSKKIKEKFSFLYEKNKNIAVDKNIENAVNKIYEESTSLITINSPDNKNLCVAVLNLCQVYGRKFKHNFVYPAIIIQQVYLKDDIYVDKNFGDAAFILEKILRMCPVTIERADKIASVTHKIYLDLDKSMDNHIRKMLSVNQTEKIENDTFEQPQRLAQTEFNEKDDQVIFYLKKWIFGMFTSILNPHSLLFVCDQLFLNQFENEIFQDISLALLGLLRPWLLHAKNKNGIKKVFLQEPSLLYLLDIRRALCHIRNKKNYTDISVMNRNIKLDGKDSFIPEPTKPIVSVPDPVIKSPKIVPPKAIPKFIPWVPHNKESKESIQVRGKVNIPFDLYVDSIRFIPDNATVTKITGKLLNMYLNQKSKFIKFQTFSDVNSNWRYPDFKFKLTINNERLPMNPDVVIMLRVYTIEKHSKSTFVLGSCLFGPFSNKHNQDIKLKIGGHQIRVRNGVPDPDFDVEHMLASHMDNNPTISGVTILLRILPKQEEFIPAPNYTSNYYRSESAKPNESENKLYDHYKKSENLSLLVKDSFNLITEQVSTSEVAVKQLIQEKFQKEGSEVEDFPYQRFVNYCKSRGMMVLVDKAAGLPIFLEGRYLQCLVQIFPGEDTKVGDGKMQAISFITNDLELESAQRAPDWSDQPKKVNLEYDDKAFILISLYGLRPRFDTISEKLLDKDGREPKFNLQHAIAWTAAPCFDKGAVFAGIHQIPLLKGKPSDNIIEKLNYLPLDFICKKFKDQVKVFEAASIEISIWDGHFANNESPPLPVHTNNLNISKNPNKYIKAYNNKTGATVADLIKAGLPNSAEYSKYKRKIVQLLNESFKSNLDYSLVKSGYKATI